MLVPVMLVVFMLGSVVSGAVSLDPTGVHVHKEALAKGNADFSNLNK